MENRERDQVSKRSSPTDAGRLNRETSEEIGRERNSGTSAEFGQSIGRSENLREGGEMNRRDQNTDRQNIDRNEESRRSGTGEIGTSTGRSGSVGNMGGGGSEMNRDRNRNSSGSLGSTGESSVRDRDRNDSSEGRH